MTAIAELAARRLSDARAKAKANIELWNKAVEVVHEAERQAECWIQLPESLVKDLVAACSQIESADYLTCLAINQLAIRSAQDVQGIATRFLEGEVRSRIIVVNETERDINSAINCRDGQLQRAERWRLEANAASKRELETVLHKSDTNWETKFNSIREGVCGFLGFIWVIAAVWNVCMSSFDLGEMLCMGILMIPIAFLLTHVSVAVLTIRNNWELFCSKSEAPRIYERRCESAMAELSQRQAVARYELEQKLPNLHEAKHLAESRLKKAELALDLIKQSLE